MRLLIAERIEAGDSDEEIRDFVASRYGREVLLDPSGSGFGALVWALPVIFVVVAVAGLVVRFRDYRPGARTVTEADRDLVADALASPRRASREVEHGPPPAGQPRPSPARRRPRRREPAADRPAGRRPHGRRAGRADGPGEAGARPRPRRAGRAGGAARLPAASLEDLDREHDAGDLEDDDYQTLKDDYTARAADVLRAIDERRAAFADARRPRSLGRTLAWVAGVALFALRGRAWWWPSAMGARKAGETSSGGITVAETVHPEGQRLHRGR